MTFSAGIYSSLNAQMGEYRKERDAENVENKRLKYKLIKKNAEEKGMDISASKIASMLERVSNVVEAHNENSEPPYFQTPGKEKPNHKHSIVSLILRSIRQGELSHLWNQISNKQSNDNKLKQLQSDMKSDTMKEKINAIVEPYVEGKASAQSVADEVASVISGLADEHDIDLDSLADTTLTNATEEEIQKYSSSLKIPSNFDEILKQNYKDPKIIYKISDKSKKMVAPLKGVTLFALTKHGKTTLGVQPHAEKSGTIKPLTISQLEILKTFTPVV